MCVMETCLCAKGYILRYVMFVYVDAYSRTFIHFALIINAVIEEANPGCLMVFLVKEQVDLQEPTEQVISRV